MKYDIIIEKLAEKFIMKLSRIEKERVLKAIYKLPDGSDIKRLKGKKSKVARLFGANAQIAKRVSPQITLKLF